VSYKGEGSGASDDYVWTFEQKGGAWVPKSYQETDNYTGSDGISGKSVEKIDWTANTINAPIAPAEFGLDRMGINAGDWVQNLENHAHFQYADGTPDEVAQKSDSDVRNRN